MYRNPYMSREEGSSRGVKQFFCECWAKDVCSSCNLINMKSHNKLNWILKLKNSKIIEFNNNAWFHVQRANGDRERQAILEDLSPSQGSVDVAETTFFCLVWTVCGAPGPQTQIQPHYTCKEATSSIQRTNDIPVPNAMPVLAMVLVEHIVL